MCTPNGTRTGRRVRTAGLTLVVLSALALLIGLVVTGVRAKQTGTTGQHPAHAAPSVAPRAPASPPLVPYPPPAPSRPAPAPVVPPPVQPSAPPEAPESAPAGASSASSDKSFHRVEVRVYNNSTIRGLAARLARDLAAAGWTVSEVGNYPQGTIPTSTVYYQEGTGQRAAAEALGAQFRMRVEPRFPGIANASPGLIVIVTNDYESP
jgi:LytR cell envelope-related transcriptional attenuator